LSIPVGGSSVLATLNVTTIANSNSGAPRQTIESIRNNAPIAFATQQRLVTAEDYKAVILQNYASVTDAISWGGEDNVPTRYGSVFVSLNFQDGTSADQKQAVKDSIVANITDNLSIMSVETVFADPIDTFLEVQAIFNFDPSLSGLTVQATEAQIFPKVINYFNENLSSFGEVWRRSELLAIIDDVSPAILNSNINIKIQQRFIPTIDEVKSYTIFFPVELAEPDDINTIVTSSTFVYNGKTCSIKNQLASNKLQVVDTTGSPVVDNIGSYNDKAGTVTLTGFSPEQITSGNPFIKLSATPANQSTIRPLRNYIIRLDQDVSFASGAIDRQTLQVSL